LAETAGICSDLLLSSKGHRLRKSISIFRLLHLEERIGFCQCLERTGSTAQRTNHRYGQAQAEASHGEQPIGIWGGDETFMVCPFSWPWN